MKNILITGGSGLIGSKLTTLLERKGYKVAWLSRKPAKKKQKSFSWNIQDNTIDDKALEWCDGIIHLAGAGVADKRWTDQRKKEILESRTLSARLLYDAILKMEKKPQVYISASGINYYGYDTGDQLIEEDNVAGTDFLADVVQKWEAGALMFQSLGLRTVILRTGLVLDKKDGALAELLKPPVAAPLGNGNQFMSWIHINDLTALYAFVLEKQIAGIFNAVAPHPVINSSFTKLAAKAKGKPYVSIPVPAFMLKIILGEMSNMVLGGIKVSSEKIQKAGFKFKYPFLQEALNDIFD